MARLGSLRSVVFFSLVFVIHCAQSWEITVGILEGELEEMAGIAYNWSGDQSRLRLVTVPRANATLAYDKGEQVHDYLEKHGVHCIIGYHDNDVSRAAEKLNVFYLTTTLSNEGNDFTANMLPNPGELTEPLLDVMKRYDWTNIGIIYSETLDSKVINTLVEKSNMNLNFNKLRIFPNPDAIRTVILNLRRHQFTKFLLLTGARDTREVFKQARRLGIIANPFSWLVLNLGRDDVVSGILDDLLTNVTMVNFVRNQSLVKGGAQGKDQLTVALMRDSLTAIELARTEVTGQTLQEQRLELSRVLHAADFDGETGHVEFDDYGTRINYTVDLVVFNGAQLIPIGNWRSHPKPNTSKLTLRIMFPRRNDTHAFPLHGKTARVVTILEPPFAMLKEGHENLKGNARFEGFAVDMMEEVSKMLEFQYELYVVHDGNFGIRMENGEWNGMIGEVLSGNATMSMAPISINTEREQAVDFTKPFKTRSIMVLVRTPEFTSGYFQFMNPLSQMVWLCILLSIVSVTIVLYLLEKYSNNVSKIMPRLNARESAWFIFGAIVGGGSETSPMTIPGRIMVSAWWFFALILTSTYTANLAAFLTVKKINVPITNVGELLEQNKITYGTVRNSGVMNFLSSTSIEPYSKMWTQMSEIIPNAMVDNTTEALARVKNGNYAFLWDNTVTHYWATTDCEVTEIGPAFDPKGFGIAVPPGAIYLEELSLAILKLSDSGKIIQLENEWWNAGGCEDSLKPSTGETTELTLQNVAGLFFVLICGALLAGLAMLAERLLHTLRERTNKKKSNEHGLETTNYVFRGEKTNKPNSYHL